MVQCKAGAGDKVTVGCLAQDFSPQSVTFQWTDASGSSLTSLQYPPSQKNNKYTGVSVIQVPKSDWDSRKTFSCSVTHPAGNASVPLQKRDENHRGDGSEPKVTVHVLPHEVIEKEGSAKVTLVCLVSSHVQQNFSISWSEHIGRKAGPYTDGINFPPQKSQDGYLVTSVYTTTNWNTHKFECNVRPPGSNKSVIQEVSKDQDSFLSCTNDVVEEDEFSSLWSTASSFIFLFIFSALYSMTFSLVKMKK